MVLGEDEGVVTFSRGEAASKLEVFRPAVEKAIQYCEQLIIDSPAAFTKGGTWLKAAKGRRAEIEDKRKEYTGPLLKLKSTIDADFVPIRDKYDQCILVLTKKMAGWDRRLREEAKKREMEIRAQQEKQAGEEKAAAEIAAKKAEDGGDQELAQDIREEANKPIVPVVIMPHQPQKVEGLATRREWKARVVDLEKVPMEFCEKVPNQSLLNSMARHSKGMTKIAGVEFYEDTGFARSGRHD